MMYSLTIQVEPSQDVVTTAQRPREAKERGFPQATRTGCLNFNVVFD